MLLLFNEVAPARTQRSTLHVEGVRQVGRVFNCAEIFKRKALEPFCAVAVCRVKSNDRPNNTFSYRVRFVLQK